MSWVNERMPEVAKTFTELSNSVFKEGTLDLRTKELISVAVAGIMRCERCTEVHARPR